MHVSKRNDYLKKSARLQIRFGAVVRASRERLDISQEELGWRAGLHRTYITDIERGARNLTLRSVAALAHALEVSVSSLLASAGEAGDEGPGFVAGNPRAGAFDGALGEILLVEDNPVDAQLTLHAFKKAKFTNPVCAVTDGAQALDYLAGEGEFSARKSAEPPALVLLDLQLPKVSGLDVLRRIKGDPLTRSIPVVVLTASRLHRDVQECLQLGAGAYLVKPVGFENFRKTTAGLNMNWALLKSAQGSLAGSEAGA